MIANGVLGWRLRRPHRIGVEVSEGGGRRAGCSESELSKGAAAGYDRQPLIATTGASPTRRPRFRLALGAYRVVTAGTEYVYGRCIPNCPLRQIGNKEQRTSCCSTDSVKACNIPVMGVLKPPKIYRCWTVD
jgi:hypothetical protein